MLNNLVILRNVRYGILWRANKKMLKLQGCQTYYRIIIFGIQGPKKSIQANKKLCENRNKGKLN